MSTYLAAILLALALTCSIQSRAATYYVSASTGNDSNNGTTQATPWQSLDKVSIQAVFAAGDQILLNRGDVWDGYIAIVANGTAANPILISAYGTGANPIIYGDAHLKTYAPVAGHTGVYTTTLGYSVSPQGFYEGTTQLTQAPNTTSTCGGHVCDLTNPTDLNTYLSTFVPGNYGYDIGASNTNFWVATLDRLTPTTVKVFHTPIDLCTSPNHTTIENLDIRSVWTGIFLECTASNMIVQNNSIQDALSIGIYLSATSSGSMVNNIIQNNTINRTGNDGLYTLMASGSVFRGNTVSNVTNSVLGIGTVGDQCGIGLQQSINTVVEHNTFTDMHGSCFDYYYETGSTVRYNYCNNSTGTGGAAPHGTGLSVYYNIFNEHGHGSGINSVNTGATPNLVYNNTFYTTTSYGLYGGDSQSDGGTGGVVYRNNLVVATSGILMARGDRGNQIGTRIDSDYNLFYTTRTQQYTNLGTSYSTLVAYQAASSQEAHSTFSAPQFVSAAPALAADFRLQSTSPGTGAGQNLRSAGFVGPTDQYVDYAGYPIPPGSQPNIGAYQ